MQNLQDIDEFMGNKDEKKALEEFIIERPWDYTNLLSVIDGKSCIGKSSFIKLMVEYCNQIFPINVFHIKYDDDVHNTLYNFMFVKTITEFMRTTLYKLIIIDDFDIIQEIHQNILPKMINVFDKVRESNIRNVKVIILTKQLDRKLIFPSNINILYLTIRGISLEDCKYIFRDYKYFEKDIEKAHALFKGSIYHVHKFLETCEKQYNQEDIDRHMIITEKINMIFEKDNMSCDDGVIALNQIDTVESNNVCFALYHNIHEYIKCKYNVLNYYKSHQSKMEWYSNMKKISESFLLGGVLEYKSIMSNNWVFQEYGNIIRMYSVCLNMAECKKGLVSCDMNKLYIGKHSNTYSRSIQHHNNSKKINNNLSDHNLGYLHMMTLGDIMLYENKHKKTDQLFAIYIYTTHICNHICAMTCPKKKSIIIRR